MHIVGLQHDLTVFTLLIFATFH